MTAETAMDQRELAEVIEQYRPTLMRRARRYDRRDAEDLVQDAILRALRKAAQCEGRAVLRWLLAILRNTAADRARRARRIPRPIGLFEVSENVPNTTAADASVLLAKTTPEGRRMLILAAEGYTYKEIARICKCSTHHVRYRLADTRARLRRGWSE